VTGPAAFRGGIAAHNPLAEPASRLICCTFAGGSAMAYAGWPAFMPEGVEVAAFELPGRGARFAEPAFDRLPDAVDHLAGLLEDWRDRPFTLYGHSMGAATALELCKRLTKAPDRPGAFKPDRLIVSGCAAPHVPSLRPRRLWDMPRDDLLHELTLLGGLPEEILANDKLLDAFLPTIRADMRCREEAPADVRDIAIPIHVMAGRDDRLVVGTDLGEWQRYTTAATTVTIFDGDHFFIATHRDRALAHVARLLGGGGERAAAGAA